LPIIALEEEEGFPTTPTFWEYPSVKRTINTKTEKKCFIIKYFICKLLIKKQLNKEIQKYSNSELIKN